MNPDRQLSRERYVHNMRMGQELARRLAREAEQIAVTLDRLAAVHDALAGTAGHPLSARAGARAAHERRMAARERVASGWFRSIADGGYQPGTDRADRLPSQ